MSLYIQVACSLQQNTTVAASPAHVQLLGGGGGSQQPAAAGELRHPLQAQPARGHAITPGASFLFPPSLGRSTRTAPPSWWQMRVASLPEASLLRWAKAVVNQCPAACLVLVLLPAAHAHLWCIGCMHANRSNLHHPRACCHTCAPGSCSCRPNNEHMHPTQSVNPRTACCRIRL